MLDHICQWLASLDWESFVPQLLAAVVAAGIGLVGVVWAMKAQRHTAYVESVDNAMVRVLEEISLRAAAITRHQHELRVFQFAATQALISGSPAPAPVIEPNDFSLDVVIDIAEMRTRGRDQVLTREIRHAFNAIRSAPLNRQLEGLGLLEGSVSRWRSGTWGEPRVRQHLQQVQAVVNRGPVTDAPEGAATDT